MVEIKRTATSTLKYPFDATDLLAVAQGLAALDPHADITVKVVYTDQRREGNGQVEITAASSSLPAPPPKPAHLPHHGPGVR